MITTRGRYALRVLCDIADYSGDGYVSLKEICERQDVSRKYLENIMNSLAKAGLVESSKGKSGGYRLIKSASDYSLGEILRVTEGDLAPVSCAGNCSEPCSHMEGCPTHPVWEGLNNVINEYLDGVSLADIKHGL